jgi:antibiotic biosynthesis monooxygenase (ABM) superfamily enzyme
MPTIVSNQGVVTQINVFTTDPERIDALVALLTEAAHFVRDVPGWMSASLHVSQERDRVVNYAQCRDLESWRAVMDRLVQGGFLERNRRLGVAHPGLYEVVATIVREDEEA